MFTKILVPFLLVLTSLSLLLYSNYHPSTICQTTDTFHIALVGPMSGNGSIIGQSLQRGVSLFVDQLNSSGGINGQCIAIDMYDDQNDRTLAVQKASEIASDNRAIAVVGHWFSSCSFAAGMVYKKNQIPSITPGSTNVKVTRFNPWYFRLVFNDHLQGRFLANYAIQILDRKKLMIIHEDSDYANYLATVFEATGQKYDTDILFSKCIAQENDLRKPFIQAIESIKTSIMNIQKEAVLFIAGHASFSSQLIYNIRHSGINIPIIVPDSCASDAFWKEFQKYPKERQFPGYYSNGIYVTTHLLFDIGNSASIQFYEDYHERYQIAPDWIAAHAYDALLMITEAIKRQNITTGEPIQSARQKIKDSLTQLDSIDQAIEGVTGLNCFDRNGDSIKPVSVGYYRNQKIIPAHVQFQAVPRIVNDTEANQKAFITIDGQHFYKTCVVYTGVNINEIYDINTQNNTSYISFDIWFRFHGNINISQIDFINAAEPVTLGEPVEIENNGHLQYYRYKIKGRFKTNFLKGHTTHRCQLIGFQLYHPMLERNQLIFVPDKIGMGLKKRSSFLDHLSHQNIIANLREWTLDKTWLFQSILKKESFGKLEYLNTTEHTRDHSVFNVGVRIQKSQMSIRGVITKKNAKRLMIICGFLVLLAIFLKNQFPKSLSEHPMIHTMFLSLSLVISIFFLLAIESFIMNRLIESVNSFYLNALEKFFDVSWWVVPAIFINSFVYILIWKPIEKSTGQRIPNIVRRFVSFMILTLTCLGILAFVFDQKITSLLATSGVIAMIIGLAIQINISNIFSGIAINLERPFTIGDWVKVGDCNEGKVLDITWRTTRLITRDDCILSIPNSVASESVIQNYHFPDDRYRLWFYVYVDSSYEPERIKNVLFSAVSASQSVQKKPEPLTRFMGLTDWAAQYMVSFTVKDYENRANCMERVWTRVLSHLHQAGVKPATRQLVYESTFQS